jgi:ubiquinone/menaquinone biosynthesis C-methylase UbiE
MVTNDEWPYWFSTEELSAMLHLDAIKSDSIIIDLCCGTGVFTFWIAEQRPDVHVIGIDDAPHMLNEAMATASEKKIKNVSFLCKSVTELKEEHLHLPEQSSIEVDQLPVAMIVSFLGFSAMENYAEVFRNTLSLLPEGGTYLIADMYREPKILNRVANFFYEGILLGANSLRRCFDPMQEMLAEYQIYQKTIPDDIFRIPTMSPYIARGVKKSTKGTSKN